MPDPSSTSAARRALIVVDVQRDFCEGGSLAVEGGRDLARRIDIFLSQNRGKYAKIVATKDTHWPGNPEKPSNEGHISPHPNYVDSWPAHCVQ